MSFKLLVLAVFVGYLEASDLKAEYQKRCLLNADDFNSPHRCSDGKEIISFFYEKKQNSCHAVKHLSCHGDPKFFKNLEYCLLACTGKPGSVSEYSPEALKAEVKDAHLDVVAGFKVEGHNNGKDGHDHKKITTKGHQGHQSHQGHNGTQ